MHAVVAGDAMPLSDSQRSHALPAQLVREATGGDLEAFEELVRRLQRRVYGFAYQHLRDSDEAHDPALVEALAQLDPGYRLPVLLHYYADLSLDQVARALNVTVPAIKSRLHRARAQLRNSLAEAEQAEESGSSTLPRS